MSAPLVNRPYREWWRCVVCVVTGFLSHFLLNIMKRTFLRKKFCCFLLYGMANVNISRYLIRNISDIFIFIAICVLLTSSMHTNS